MPELQAIVVDIPRALDRMGPVEVWQEMERAMPAAFQPLCDLLAVRAPVGSSGKLASGGFAIRMNRRSQGLIHGIDVQVGAADPVAHLVAEGHAIIPRGPGRAATAAAASADPQEMGGAQMLSLLRDVGVERFQEILQVDKLSAGSRERGRKRDARATLRAALKARREAGAIGFVAGNPWVEEGWAEQREGIVARLEQELAAAFR